MPVTAKGTAYTVTTIDLGAPHGLMVYALPDRIKTESNIPTILYAHGAGGAYNNFTLSNAWSGLRDSWIDAGGAYVEGSGGSSVGPQNWGNDVAMLAYPAYLATAKTKFSVGKVALLGRSMGGLVTAHLYANDTVGEFAGWVNNSGVSTVFISTEDVRSSAEYFAPTILNSWEVATQAELLSAMTLSNAVPELYPQSMWEGKNILCCYGDEDTTVPWAVRGAEPLTSIWGDTLRIGQVALRPGGDHSGGNGSYFQVNDMMEFLADVCELEPFIPETTIKFQSHARFIVRDNLRYRVTPAVVG